MSRRDARLTLDGLRQQNEEGLRALGQIMVDIWSDKKTSLNPIWRMPLDGPSVEDKNTADRLFQRLKDLNELKQKQQNGN